MSQKISIALPTLSLLRQYNVSPGTNRIFKKFLTLEDVFNKHLDVSSDSTQNTPKHYLRAILSRLRRDELMKLLSQQDLHGLDLDKLIFSNRDDPCFAIGINDYKTNKIESRLKLYSFYYLLHKKINVHKHITTMCSQCGISPSWVAKDFDLLKDIRISCADLYLNGSFALKVYSQFFLTKDILGKYQGVFTARTLDNYKRLFYSKYLPKVGMLCIRYYGKSRSIRIDFLCNTTRVRPYLDTLDLSGSAMRLYDNIAGIGKLPKLKFITIDFNKKPRTQFYFNIY